MLKFKHFIKENHHPKLDDDGNKVKIHNPDSPSPEKHWHSSEAHAATVPGHKGVPQHINGISTDSAKAPSEWKGVHGQGDFSEHEFHSNKKKSVGIVMVEPDKRVWVTHPTNQFGGYSATFPKGTVEHHLNHRENAIKETHEETGLKAEIHGHLGDYEKTTSTTRYYHGRRTGGNPSDMGWESQKVSLVPIKDLHKVVTHPKDEQVVRDIQNKFK